MSTQNAETVGEDSNQRIEESGEIRLVGMSETTESRLEEILTDAGVRSEAISSASEGRGR